ncbi:DUF4913 domain-containing protein [Nocardioides sp.]|uniref:DUF4913 domain-containing protein n=1 Tax=Nocardioides sp. TaxID=35761 RepID=UPI002B54FCF9|nr:DUF4913 domain-containing protein [Nocardioides sp.]HXH78993.1 DUF4913 domain-containing protein [Nocardioides sp.]
MNAIGEWADDPDDWTPDPDLPAADAAPAAEATPELQYGSVDEFVREIIVPVFRRKVAARNASRWDAEWWRYPEAVIRLEALWRAWEHLRLDPATGMSVWLRDHADHHLTVLFSDEGRFGKSSDTSDHGSPLPYTPPPESLFPDVRARSIE